MFRKVSAAVIIFFANYANAENSDFSGYFWVEARDGQLVLDATGNDVLSKETDSLLLKLTEKNPEKKPRIFELSPTDAPPFLDGFKNVKVLTPSGVSEVKPVIFEVSEGCSSNQLVLKTSTPGSKDGIAVVGKNISPNSKVNEIEQTPKDKTEFSMLRDKIFDSWNSSLNAKDRIEFKKNKIGSSKIQFVRLKLKKGNDVWLAWIYEEFPEDKSGVGRSFTAASLFDKSGKALQVLDPIKFGSGNMIHGWQPKFVTDLNGDGENEVIVKTSYYEGSSIILYEADNGKLAAKTLYANGC